MPEDQADSQRTSADSPPHVIRLRGPWQCEPLAFTQWSPNGEAVDLPGDVPAAGTVKIPADWSATLGAEFRGRVLYKRRFGRPPNLDSIQRIDLVLKKINGSATISLNGSHLGMMEIGASVSRFELTNLLLPRNTLDIEVNLPRGLDHMGAGGIVGEVQIEIYEAAR